MTVAPATPRDVVETLRAHGVGDVDHSTLAKALYSTDASLYRVPPQVVVRPREEAELLAALAAARETATPVTMRGSGTSIAGNAIGPGVVVDTRKHLAGITVHPDRESATVQPGVVHADLQRAAAPHGLRFGPDPSTHTRCTIGGMIGNNACGSRALGYGRTSDNVLGMRVALADGTVLDTRDGHAGLQDLVDAHLGLVRTEFGRFGRQVSGYSFEHLLPEKGRDLGRFLTGTEGTLAVVLDAEVRLVRDAPGRALAVLGYPDMFEAADAVPALLAGHRLVACEGLDRRITDVVARFGGAVPPLPEGSGWLFAEVTADSAGEAEALARAVAADAGVPHRIVTDAAEQATLWRIREDGAGLAARTLPSQAKSGWEDAAVPPERLGAYLRDFQALLDAHGLDAAPYGHFGDGCVHARIDFRLDDASGQQRFREVIEASADLVASYGGSMSGEHGDGRARSELLGRMYSAEAIALMGQAKRVLDPTDLLNPGVLVRPSPFDADLRDRGRHGAPIRTTLRLLEDGGSFSDAVHRCTGVGKCTANNTGSGQVMCPSYLASGDEKDSTRGRSRVLQEVANGSLVDGFADDAVAEALDLCLACKGCARDCPTGIDMATYKSEALHQRYRRRLRPRSHYALGQLPRWARMAPPRLANAAMRSGLLGRVAKAAAGVDQRRSLPTFSERPWSRDAAAAARTPDVWLWADSFTDRFAADAGRAAVGLLEAGGLRVGLVEGKACCGLTWITTGQLGAARRIIGQAVETLHPYVASGVPVVGLEPSCLATLRSDAVELVEDPRAIEVAEGMRSLAEFLSGAEGWSGPDLTGVEIVAQPHCHHHAVIGWDTDQRLLESLGASVTRVGGCCGLAGNFGVEVGHYETSVAVAETALMPAVRAAGTDTVLLADGFSCRTQLADLAPGRRVVTLAELLRERLVR
ncbi:lactate dehydrogenase [Marmoricola endophyticus]|uniref:Lactate dehydrogenase n=1 Tax=Marmoricola endophyticus TaxID=2040280 RepID=A0A917BIM7_9ACTN|nr:FAD-binding and (Fe-S)-binding domain-containing protein [Marmoricola endophyticus]GGF43192.1 lactate dehydrogenase [Marmoricola endophyticus]